MRRVLNEPNNLGDYDYKEAQGREIIRRRDFNAAKW